MWLLQAAATIQQHEADMSFSRTGRSSLVVNAAIGSIGRTTFGRWSCRAGGLSDPR